MTSADFEHPDRSLTAEQREGEDRIAVGRARHPPLPEGATRGVVADRMRRNLSDGACGEPLKIRARGGLDAVEAAPDRAEQPSQAVHNVL